MYARICSFIALLLAALALSGCASYAPYPCPPPTRVGYRTLQLLCGNNRNFARNVVQAFPAGRTVPRYHAAQLRHTRLGDRAGGSLRDVQMLAGQPSKSPRSNSAKRVRPMEDRGGIGSGSAKTTFVDARVC